MMLFRGQGMAVLDTMLFRETFPAAGACGVLRDENGMPAHGSLSAVVGNIGGCETETDEVTGMPHDCIQSLFIDIAALLLSRRETRPET